MVLPGSFLKSFLLKGVPWLQYTTKATFLSSLLLTFDDLPRDGSPGCSIRRRAPLLVTWNKTLKLKTPNYRLKASKARLNALKCNLKFLNFFSKKRIYLPQYWSRNAWKIKLDESKLSSPTTFCIDNIRSGYKLLQILKWLWNGCFFLLNSFAKHIRPIFILASNLATRDFILKL